MSCKPDNKVLEKEISAKLLSGMLAGLGRNQYTGTLTDKDMKMLKTAREMADLIVNG